MKDTPYRRGLRDKYGARYWIPKEGTIDGIIQTILSISGSYRDVVLSELQQSKLLLAALPPDLSGALFHAYRAVDGYLDSIIMRPIVEVTMDPIAHLFDHDYFLPVRVLHPRFIRPLRDRVLQTLCSSDEVATKLMTDVRQFDVGSANSRLRNEVFHGFIEPRVEQVKECMRLAERITDTIESERRIRMKAIAP